MREEDIHEYFYDSRVKPGDTRAVTHRYKKSREDQQWEKISIGDSEAGREQLSLFVWEASSMKAPVRVKEVLTPNFALYFDVNVRGHTDKSFIDEIKKMSSRFAKTVGTYYPNLDGKQGFVTTCAIYATATEAGSRGHVVFPEIIVNVDRHREIRQAILEDFEGDPLMQKYLRFDMENDLSRVIAPLPSDSQVAVPLAMLDDSGVSGGSLAPLAVAKIVQGRVTPLPAPGEGKASWVLLGLKRREMHEPMTEWNAPQRARKGAERDKSGSSGKSAGSKPSDKASFASGYSSGGDKLGK